MNPRLDSAQRSAPANGDIEPRVDFYLEVTAVLSRKGQYGHLGGAERELTITSIQRAEPWSESLCI